MFQTILRRFFFLRKKFVEFFFSNFFLFFMGEGLIFFMGLPAGATPLDPVCIWIEDPNRNRLALNGISAINRTRFFEKNANIFPHFFFRYIFFSLKKSYHRLFLTEGEGGGGESKILARFLAPVQEASIAAEELFRLSEFCTCLT